MRDGNWEKLREITLEDMDLDASEDAYLMEDTILSDEIEDEGQRLILVFDYMTDRAFYIEMKSSETGKNLKRRPVHKLHGHTSGTKW